MKQWVENFQFKVLFLFSWICNSLIDDNNIEMISVQEREELNMMFWIERHNCAWDDDFMWQHILDGMQLHGSESNPLLSYGSLELEV